MLAIVLTTNHTVSIVFQAVYESIWASTSLGFSKQDSTNLPCQHCCKRINQLRSFHTNLYWQLPTADSHSRSRWATRTLRALGPGLGLWPSIVNDRLVQYELELNHEISKTVKSVCAQPGAESVLRGGQVIHCCRWAPLSHFIWQICREINNSSLNVHDVGKKTLRHLPIFSRRPQQTSDRCAAGGTTWR